MTLVDRVYRLVPAADLHEDVLRPGGPDEGSWVGVGLGEEALDRGLQLDERAERAPPEPAPGQLGEEPLDGVEPRGRGRGEVEGPAGMPLQPRHHLGMLMGAVVVQHGVDPAPWTKGPRPSGAGQLPSEPTRATSRYGQAGRLSPVVTRDQA